MLWYLRNAPNLPCQPVGGHRQPVGVPVTGAQKGGGVRDRGSNDPPPPPHEPIFPLPICGPIVCVYSKDPCLSHSAVHWQPITVPTKVGRLELTCYNDWVRLWRVICQLRHSHGNTYPPSLQSRTSLYVCWSMRRTERARAPPHNVQGPL